MLLFWSLAILLLAVTLAFLLPPLVRVRRGAAAPDADAAAIAVYRDQKRALDADLASGAISAAERDAAVLELSRRLGEEVGMPKQPSRPPRPRVWTVAIALLIAIPLAAIALYARLGSPDAAAPGVAGSAAPAPHDVSDPQIIAMVEKLAQRMKARPDDGEGWALLARSYAALGRFPEAADAYARADALIPDNPALLADYADTLAMTQGKRLAGKPVELIQRALALDPREKKALALAASAAMEAHDLDGSLGYWRRLAAEVPPESDDARQVNAIIAEIEADKGGSKAGAGAKAAPQTPAAAPPASDRTQAARSAGGTIAGRVEIAPALASKVVLTDTVFIFARAVDGPRAPLAVLRLTAGELPRDFTLDDSMGMGPGAKLSATSAVVVEARVSKSGNALPQPGDLIGRSTAVKPGAAGVRITIDQVVP